MINPKELRIGNKVFLQNEVVTIAELEKAGATFEENGFVAVYDYLTPIPLNPEWLQRMSFDQSGEAFELGDLPIDFKIEKEGDYLYWNQSELPDVQIKNVHQLQNLYFALTGEELTIKEKV